MADTSFDVIIIGSGPGGYVTAIRAAQLGFKTAIIEKSYLGGICLNWGCIPTKALLRSAEIYHYMQHAKDYGLSADNVSYDPKAVVQRSRGVSKRLNDGVGFLMKKNKVTVIWGEASIDAPGKVTVKKSQATMAEASDRRNARHVVVLRRGAGMIPRALRIRAIELAETRIPSFRSSPWIRTHPHRRFSRPRRTMRSTRPAAIGGRPGPRRFCHLRHLCLAASRCQRSRVSGVTRKDCQCCLGSRRLSAARIARSAGRYRTRAWS